MPLTRVMKTLALLLTGVIAAMVLAGPALADPADGWMPQVPKTLNAEQKGMLVELSKDSEGKARFGDEAQKQYRMIDCADHRDFPGCKSYPDAEDSKNLQAVIYDADGNYKGLWAAVPGMLAGEHSKLADDEGVIDCATAANKIPICSKPDLMSPKPPVALKYSKSSGEFVGFRQEDGKYGLPSGQAATETCSESNGGGLGGVLKCTGDALNPANATSALLDNWFAQATETIGKFAGDLLVLSMTWWLRTDSINVTSGGILAGERPVQVVVMMIIFLGIIGSATGMAMMRRAGPAAELAMGALKFVLIASLAGVVVAGAVNASDDFAKEIITNGADFGPQMRKMLGIATLQNPGGVLVMGLIAAVLSLIQWIIGFARQAGLVILFALLIFAAAGQVSTWGRQWFPRIAAMMLSLILYKPMAAAIYKIGFTLMGSEESLSSLMVGIMTIALAILALPAMLKFFDFAATSVAGGASVAGIVAGAGMAAGAMSSMGGGGGGGDAQSNYMNSTGPGSNGEGEGDPTPGNSPEAGGGTGSGEATTGTGGEASPSSEADLGSGGMGPASEASTGPGAGGDLGGMPGAGMGEGGEMAGGAMAGGGAAAAGGPVGAGVMAAKEGLDAVAGAAESLAGEATGGGESTGPDMP